MHTYLKSYLDIWHEVHQKALVFFEDLPVETQQQIFETITQDCGATKAERIIKTHKNQDTINTRVLPYLIDFLSVERALELFRYEVWHFFASFKPIEAFQGEANILYAKFLTSLKKAETFEFKWFKTQKYTLEDLAYLYDFEKYLLMLYLQEESQTFAEDFGYIQHAYKRIKSSVEYAVYTLHFTQFQIKLHTQFMKEEKYDQELAEKCQKYIVKFFNKKPFFQIDQAHIFTPEMMGYLADFELMMSNKKALNKQNTEANQKHLDDTISQYKENYHLKHFNTTQAELDFGAGKLTIKFSTQQLLFKKYLVKIAGVFLTIVSIWGLSILGKIFSSMIFPMQWYMLFSLVSLLIVALRWTFKE